MAENQEAQAAKNQEARKKQEVVYKVGNDDVTLSVDTVKKYLVSGNPENVTTEEIVMFINLCKFNHLNPWLKEAYCIKYGSAPATMVVGKEAIQKRAESNPNYNGSDSGIIVMTEKGEVVYRKGTLKLPGDTIVGGYAEVWRKDREHSVRMEVSFDEYVAKKKDGTTNEQWTKRPATMIRKVALVQALRESFPGEIGGIYTAEEQGVEDEEAKKRDEKAIDVEAAEIHDPFSSKVQEGQAALPKKEQSAQIGGLDLEAAD